MAEALGVVASGIAVAQIAGQAGGAVLKLKRLWDEVRDVPETISDLMEQIDCLDPALWEAEQQFNQQNPSPLLWDNTAGRRSAEYCRKALQKLSGVTNDLAVMVRSKKRVHRKIGCVKVVLQKEQMRSLEQRLRNAIGMLQIAQQGYTLAFMKMQPDIIAYKVVEQVRNPVETGVVIESDKDSGSDDADASEYPYLNPDRSMQASKMFVRGEQTSRQKNWTRFGPLAFRSTVGGFGAAFRPPWWLAGLLYAWDVNITKSYGDWKTLVRTYSFRPPESEIFTSVVLGDVDAIRRGFARGEASPFDRNASDGWTLFHYAVRNMRSFRLLLQTTNSYDTQEQDIWGQTVSEVQRTSFRLYQSALEYLEILDLLKNHGFIVQPDAVVTITECRCPKVDSLATLRRLRPIYCPEHPNTTLDSRFLSIFLVLRIAGPDFILMLQEFINPEWSMDPDMVCSFVTHICCNQYTFNCGLSLMEICTNHLLLRIILESPERFISSMDGRKFAIEVIQRTKNVHDFDLEWGVVTPLAEGMIKFQFTHEKFEINPISVIYDTREHISLCLQLLEAAGVDLIQYGQRELELLQRNEGWGSRWEAPFIWPISFEIVSATDFHFYWTEITDEYAGDFLCLVEEPVYSIPGGWTD